MEVRALDRSPGGSARQRPVTPKRFPTAATRASAETRATSVTSQDEMRRLGRFVELADAEDDAFATFATAQKL